jgi:uncharacterized delta-60 repeat protein
MSAMLQRTALSLLIALAGPAVAADGAPDAGFGTDGQYPGHGFYPGQFGNDRSDSIAAVLPAGQRLYVVGNVQAGADDYRLSVYRLDANGFPDYTFGDAGLRTYVPPCAAGRVRDAVIDGAQRLWLAIAGCGNFTLYRLTADGDLDTGLLGSGVLDIAFDLGGDNADSASKLALTASGTLLIGGSAAAMPMGRLAVAHYTLDGQPVAGFGDEGKASLALSISPQIVNGLHHMPDGRVVATGYRTGNGGTHIEFVARLQPGGQADVGFGAEGPGYSVHDPLGPPTPVPGTSGGSLLLRDGSVLRVGESAGDFYLGRWRADGQPDPGFGPAGIRRYALDFAGPDPVVPQHNSDKAKRIARQGDGKYVILGESYAADGRRGISLIRLTPDFEFDPSFGDDGKLRYLVPIASNGLHQMNAATLNLLPGRILVGATVATGPSPAQMQTVAALANDLLFADAFD